ncbi:MAG TPA: choice-of-anchor Q domain-containing protein, partial [Verrucomicrobiota bacterium]|nr:choice-of-anchor Q domain-containing protein [Verrucomicrobiota bacterium]
MSSNKVITASFEAIPTFTLGTSVNGQGTVTLDPPGGTYLSNTTVNVSAAPSVGWVFVGWSGDAAGGANPVAVNMSGNKSVTGNFAQVAAIQIGPENVVAGIGDTVAFTVGAVGTPPLFYQWWFNGSMLSSTTNSLALTNIQSNQEGLYTVIVTNLYGGADNSATLTITNACSGTNVVESASETELRNAINIGGNIRLCFNGAITLTNTIDITHDVTLDARNRAVVISGNNAVRLFNVSPGVTFAATNLVFANGRHVGQNGANAGAQPAQPGFPGEGGAILNNEGTVRLVSCLLTNNSVMGGMGGLRGFPYPDDGIGGEGRGGAILNRGGTVLLQSVNMVSNTASGAPGVPDTAFTPIGTAGDGFGGAIYNTNGTVLMVDCNLIGNRCVAPRGGAGASARGGAIFQTSGTITVTNSAFLANQAYGDDSMISEIGFPKPGSAYGGAIAIMSGNLSFAGCQLTANMARGGNAYRHSGTGEAQGGAVYSFGSFSTFNTTFSENQALSGSGSSTHTDGRGGALYNIGVSVLNRCTVSSNTAKGAGGASFGGGNYGGGHGLGGGIFNGFQMTMTNCTVALNLARGGDAGGNNAVPGNGLGGGIYNSNATLVAVNITVATNFVGRGAQFNVSGTAAGAQVGNANGTLSLQNSILAYGGTNSNAWGAISDAGFNISSDGSANFNSGASFNFTDPRLMTLGYNGGLTRTMALQSNSPAIDFGAAGAPASAQRGVTRPTAYGVDMGAYEFQAAPPS